MRRSQLPKVSFPVGSASLTFDPELMEDLPVKPRPKTPPKRNCLLPPLKNPENSLLPAPPQSKPQYGRRARPKADILTISQSSTMASREDTNTPVAPWGTDDNFMDYVARTPVISASVQLPDLNDKNQQHITRHIRARPANKDMFYLNKVAYHCEPAGVPKSKNLSPEFPPINGHSMLMRIKSPRIRATSRATSNGSNTSLESGSPNGRSSAGGKDRPHLPHIDKMLQKRGLSRHNFFQ